MSGMSDDMVNGRCCQFCGTYFEDENGYPCLCHSCYHVLDDIEKDGYILTEYDEL